MLRNVMSILLSAVILLQGLNVHLRDVLELKVLVDHMQYHQSSYGDDLYSFIEKHYGVTKTSHEEGQNDEEHENLPFKHTSDHHNASVLVITPVNSARDFVNCLNFTQRSFHYQENYTFLNQADIFQPPRTA